MPKLEIEISAVDKASGVLGGIASMMKNAFSVAIGQTMFEGLRAGINAMQDLGAEALDAYASYERLGLSLQSLVARELRAGDATLDMKEALAQAGPKAQELIEWIQKLAIESPFGEEGVAAAYRQAMAYGFTTNQAKELTQVLIDFAAGSGATEDSMRLIALAMGQVQAKGRLMGSEVLQLTNAGLPMLQILAKSLGKTTAETSAMITGGAISADMAFKALTTTLRTEFEGAAKAQATTFSGLIATFNDIKRVGLREFFTGTFQAIQPYLANFAAALSDPAVRANIRAVGDALGANVKTALQWINDNGVPYVRALWQAFQSGGLGGLLGKIGTDLGGVWNTVIWPEISTWPGKFWAWVTGPGGLLEMATGTLNKITAGIMTWVSSPETILNLRIAGANMVDGIFGSVGTATGMVSDSRSAVGGFVAALVSAFAAASWAMTAIGVEMSIGIVDGVVAHLADKRVQDKLVDAFNHMFANINNRINPIHLLFDAADQVLRGYAEGGVVPGAMGAPQLAVVHGGETIIPTRVTNNYFNQTINTRASAENVAQSFYMMQYLARAYQ